MNSVNKSTERILAVTVDTEEEGLWGDQFSAVDNTTENLKGLPRFQSICEGLQVTPTYLVDAPVVQDRTAMNLMRVWQESAACEVGAHCHAWCNPPIDDEPVSIERTFLHRYPKEVQFAKLQWLTDRIADATGRRPTSYRSGRYGFDGTTAEVLDDLGYVVDSSVLPLFEYRSEGGPDFVHFDRFPSRWFGTESARKLAEVPVTSGFVRPRYELQKRIWLAVRNSPWRQMRVPGIADRLGIARRVKLTPEGTTISDQKKLIDACVADGQTTLVLMLHSSSLVPGLSPYSRDETHLESFYARFSETIDYAVSAYGFRSVGLTQAASVAVNGQAHL